MASGGRVAFSGLLRNQDVWALPIDPNEAAARGELERLTTSPASDEGPSVSSDGRKLVFRSNRSGDWSIWFKDLDTDKETALTTANPKHGRDSVISPDGSKVVYTLRQGREASMFVVAINQHTPQTLCEGCGGAARSWSSDGSMILHHRPYERTIHLRDVTTGEQTEILRGSQRAPSSAHFSLDDRWITFISSPSFPLPPQTSQADRTRVLVAAFRGKSPIPEQDWIAVTSGEFHDNKPRWSPDGNLIYFTSTRDGFGCIWAIRLDPATKRPVGEPFEVRHFHRTRLSMSVSALAGYELSVARDKLVFELTEITGNIWILEPTRRED
jgi:Tol biopolymer transport system component